MFRATVSPIFRDTLTVYTAFWNNVPILLSGANRWYRLDGIQIQSVSPQAVESFQCSKKLYIQSECSWRWVKLSPETCRASIKESIKQILLHLVGCWYHCTKRDIWESAHHLSYNLLICRWWEVMLLFCRSLPLHFCWWLSVRAWTSPVWLWHRLFSKICNAWSTANQEQGEWFHY